MRVWMAFLAALPACGFATPGQSDAGGDDSGSGTDALFCYGSLVAVCFPVAPTMERVQSTNIAIDTDSSPMCDQGNDKTDSYCVIAAAGFSLAGRITAQGSRPLVLLSTTTFALSGEIDVSSRQVSPAVVGAGAASAGACPSMTAATGTAGGHGGSFSGKGGDGSEGNPSNGIKGIAGAALTSLPTSLRGGCAGGDAIAGDGSATAGRGGAGGGAVAIVAATINLNGRINASGAGGRGGSTSSVGGGGGGGAGGMIVLDAPTISPGGQELLWANGGGGGQGGGIAPGTNGSESNAPISPALGGFGGAMGAFGGAGSVGGDRAGKNAQANAAANTAGGGGGGGAGFIRAPGVTGDISISPPASP